MRTRLPDLRTLPSSTVATLSLAPTSAMSIPFSRNRKDDERAATWRPSNCVSALMISSVMPSLKYSLSGSALMLANGSTAIDFAPAVSSLDGDAVRPGSVTATDAKAAASSEPVA